VLKRILLFVRPLHVSLFVNYRVPPGIENPLTPLAASDKEASQAEATAILCHDKVNAADTVVACHRECRRIEREYMTTGVSGRMFYLLRIVHIDVTISAIGDRVENV
jgi:hypothetical protein